MATHMDNIITGMTFSYTFCDSETALRDAVLTLGGMIDKGMKAFTPRETDLKFYRECQWVINNRNWQGWCTTRVDAVAADP